VLRTRYEDRKPVEHTDVVFDGVLAYHFKGDNFVSILFDVKEVSIEELVRVNRDVFVRGINYAWPGPWNYSPESCLQHLNSNRGKAFEKSSSYGFGG
jgi:hypothetical protein